MAYSLLAALPAVNGLYISFFPIIIYAMFGTSRHLAIGSYALISLLTSSSVNKMVRIYEPTLNSTGLFNTTESLEAEIDRYKLTVATSLALLVGIFQILLGISGLGILTSYFSDTFISSYTCASAIHVIKSQVKDLLGIRKAISYHGAFNVPKVS
jgi:MFS superfamily sulfate permease-like transporter